MSKSRAGPAKWTRACPPGIISRSAASKVHHQLLALSHLPSMCSKRILSWPVQSVLRCAASNISSALIQVMSLFPHPDLVAMWRIVFDSHLIDIDIELSSSDIILPYLSLALYWPYRG